VRIDGWKEIAVESVQGVGSAFTATLLLAAASEDAGSPDVSSALSPPAAARGSAFVLCQEPAGVEWFDEVLSRRGWQATCMTSLEAAGTWLRVNRPAFTIVTGEYRDDTIAQLHASCAAGIVWMTPSGALSPSARGDSVFEVTEYSQRALAAAIELAVNGVERTEAANEDPASRERAPRASAAGAQVPASSALSGLRLLVAGQPTEPDARH
jgi:two-component system, NarL family, capsular synthesis sensor histidine kinase RcsC